MVENIQDRFQRSRLLYGDGFSSVQRTHFIVIGTGAVGSYCTESLARAGALALTLIDMDTIEITNINRQLYALTSTIGRAKVDVAADRIKDINPDCQVTARQIRINAENIASVIEEAKKAHPDWPVFVCDCIDLLDDKAALVAHCALNKIPICSSLGAARRQSPIGVGRAPLLATTGDALGRFLRKRLPHDMRATGATDEEVEAACVRAKTKGHREVVYAVFSPNKVMDLPDACKDSPTRLLPSGPTTTGIFGLWVGDTALGWAAGLEL